MGGLTPPVGSGLGGGIKLPEVGGVLDGSGAVEDGGGATKLPDVGGTVTSPLLPAPLPTPTAPPTPPATGTLPSVLPCAPALLSGGATKLPVVSGSCTQAAT